MLAAADAAEKRGSPPLELRQGWRSERWGLPNGRGWMNERAMMLTRMTAALRVYEAIAAWRSSRNWTKFAQEHPADWDVVSEILKLRGAARTE